MVPSGFVLLRPASLAFACLVGVLVTGWGAPAAAQEVPLEPPLDGPQAVLTPEAVHVQRPAGTTTETSLALHNEGEEDLQFAWRGVTAAGGGAYGWMDSTEPGGPDFEWTDVAESGTRLSFTGEDGVTVPLPFAFTFYGVTYEAVTVSPNGYLTFGGDGTRTANLPLPSINAPRALIAPFWDNLAADLLGTVVTHHDAATSRFIIQYTDVPRGPRALEDRVTFQVILHPDGTIRFHYDRIPESASATIGLQNDLRTKGVVLSHDDAYAEPGRAVEWYPVPVHLQMHPAEGTVPPGEHVDVTLHVQTLGLDPGAYRSTFVLETNDPEDRVISVPVRIDVGQEAFPFRVTPGRMDVELRRGEQVTLPLTIDNEDSETAHTFRLRVQEPDASASAHKSAQEGLRPRDPAGRTPVPPGTSHETIGYSSNVLGAADFVGLDLEEPGSFTMLGPSPISFAGDFPFGTDRWFYIITDADNLLQRVDVETRQRTVAGRLQPAEAQERWSGMAVNPTNGHIFASTTTEHGPSYLYEVDAVAATATQVASLGEAAVVAALAFDGEGQLYGIETRQDHLLRIDARTGEASVVGPLGFDANFDQGLDVDLATGAMYLTALDVSGSGMQAQLRRVDPETGAATVVVPLQEGMHLGYLALPSGAFVQPNVIRGVVPPGGRAQVDVTVTAGNLVAGTYDLGLRVEATDQAGTPAATVPVRMEVPGNPRITPLLPDEMSFGDVFVGSTKTLNVPIRNLGNDDLEISQFRVTSSAFSVSNASDLPLRIKPGYSKVVRVQFRPQREGHAQAHLEITSNDVAQPRVTIALSGEGIQGPDVLVTPEHLHVQVAEGQRQERTFMVRNAGGSPLSYTVHVDEDGLDTTTPPVLREAFEGGIPSSWNVIDRAGAGVRWRLHDAYPDENYNNYTGGEGGAVMASSNADPGQPFDTELWTPSMQAPSTTLALRFRTNFATQVDGTHLDLDLSTDGGGSWTTLQQWTDDLGTTFAGPGREILVDLSPHVEVGDAFRLRWRYHTKQAAPHDLYVQIDDVEVRPGTEVLTLNTTEGDVAPSGTQAISFTVDADGVPPGQYEASLLLNSNDPGVPELTIPLTLEVVDGLYAEVGDVVVHPNEHVTVPLLLAGRALSEVQSYEVALGYDPDLLRVRDLRVEGTLSADAVLSVDTSQAGVVQVAASEIHVEEQGREAQPLLLVHFQTHERLGTSPLAWHALALNEGTMPVAQTDGTADVVPLYGDATLDLAVTYADAGRIGMAVQGWASLSAAARVAADVSGDGAVSTRDAVLIRAFVEEEIPCFPVELGCNVAPHWRPSLDIQDEEKTLEAGVVAPEDYRLDPNYPNPSNPTTTITYAVPERTHVRLIIYNALGQPVRTLIDREHTAGQHQVRWDGRNEAGRPAASGVYFYRFEAGSFVRSRQLTLVR